MGYQASSPGISVLINWRGGPQPPPPPPPQHRGIYLTLFTYPEGDICFSIYQISWIKSNFLPTSKHRQAKVRRFLGICLYECFIYGPSFVSRKCLETRRHLGSGRKTVNSHEYCKLWEAIKTRENCYSLIWQMLKRVKGMDLGAGPPRIKHSWEPPRVKPKSAVHTQWAWRRITIVNSCYITSTLKRASPSFSRELFQTSPNRANTILSSFASSSFSRRGVGGYLWAIPNLL